jgi:predicted ATP-grasp superfamily ATP-dependent carboligase
MNLPRTTLAVAALSARMLAQAATRDGFGVVAMDLFGDQDTRKACTRWLPLAEPGALQIDGDRLLDALRGLARHGGVAGWVAGAGLEALPGVLEQGSRILPLIGTAPRAVQRVRDPLVFFGFLAAHGIGHPEVCSMPPPDPTGWLLKDSRGSGGWKVQAAGAGHLGGHISRHQYHQRQVQGVAMSATFMANGSDACLLGINRLLTRRIDVHPYVYRGVIGPVPLPADASRQVQRALRALSAGMPLLGLCSLDFMLDEDGQVQVLELNPRPPASMALHEARCPHGLMLAHIQACQWGDLPQLVPAPEGMQGIELVCAPAPTQIDAAIAARMARWPGCHDVPNAGTLVAAGAPLCSVTARGADESDVQSRLSDHRARLLQALAPAYAHAHPGADPHAPRHEPALETHR